ncbi:hypothetical protein F7725_002963, partial [Dissostichus mawsoni]
MASAGGRPQCDLMLSVAVTSTSFALINKSPAERLEVNSSVSIVEFTDIRISLYLFLWDKVASSTGNPFLPLFVACRKITDRKDEDDEHESDG